ncbi:MAG TPA: glycine betaine ABC transporter substrate-binding protein [Jatrophihabitantaceae bacterium]|nr:glycine betaine ABC transporter substrate-binding protein [Jatrophihabitantaceae bacterium]
MKRKTLVIATAVAALSVTLAACGKSSKSDSGGGGGGGGTIAGKMILGGPAELQTRADGPAGLQKNYGVSFQAFKVLDTGGPLTVTALKNGQVDAADLFTTDPAIKANNFVVLTDPKSNFGAQNVLPLINKAKATDGVKQVLNFISTKLTTDVLIELRTKVETNKEDPDQAAQEWLASLSDLPTSTPAKGASLTIGSANFPENVVLADIYAEALKGAGASVKTHLNIGAREKYIAALKDGSIDLLPEYSGALLQYYDKNAKVASATDVYASLQKALPANLIVLDQSAAEDQDAIVVTKGTADKYKLTSIADLANKSS